MRSKGTGIYKRMASKFRTLTSMFSSSSSSSDSAVPTPETMSTAPTTSVSTNPKLKRYMDVDSIPGTLPSGGPVEIPDEPDRSLKSCSTRKIASHISHLLRLLATAINTRDLGVDSFIWEIFHPDYTFQQDEHLPEMTTDLLEHNARMKAVLDADPKFWCKMEGDEDVRPLKVGGFPPDMMMGGVEEEVEMVVKVQIVSYGISTMQRVVTAWRYEQEGRRWRCVRGAGASDLISGLPDY